MIKFTKTLTLYYQDTKWTTERDTALNIHLFQSLKNVGEILTNVKMIFFIYRLIKSI